MYSNEVDEPKEAGLRWEVGAVTPSPHLWDGMGLETVQPPMANELVNHAYTMNPP